MLWIIITLLVLIVVLLGYISLLAWQTNDNMVALATMLSRDNTETVLILRGIKAGVLSLDNTARK